jgi:hypothetical protein
VEGDPMNVLVACEFSGVVRDAFRVRGHNAWSCDLLPTDIGADSQFHIQADVNMVLNYPMRAYGPWTGIEWDLMIAHPPCTRLTVAGARWFKGRETEQSDAIAFAEMLWSANVPRIAVENPIGVLSTRSHLGRPTQIVQPWQFGHGETKATCLWLKNLPALVPTDVVNGREARIHKMAPSPDRWKKRSITYKGIADAMAEQWGNL